MKSVFITVGTTKFDELCETITNSSCLQIFKKLGYTNIKIQYGNSDSIPEDLILGGLNITTYKFKDSIDEDIKKADLVISHAGAGTILEVLDLHKPLLVVVNTTLMNNHQFEIAEQLHIDKYLYYCTCDTLIDTLQDANFTSLQPFPKADTRFFYKYLDNFLGIKSTDNK